MPRNGERWVGPIKIKALLAACLETKNARPPNRGSAYLVTQRRWRFKPTAKSRPLYVGGITGRSHRFRTRIGDLLADIFGFYHMTNRKIGHHSGGRHIHQWCLKNQINPLNLYVAWIEGNECHRCLEIRLHGSLNPVLNRNFPPACNTHQQRRTSRPK